MSPTLSVKRTTVSSISVTRMSKHPVSGGYIAIRSGPGVKLRWIPFWLCP